GGLGVLYCQPGPSYEVLARQQMDEAAAARPGADIDGLLRQGYTWTVQN
ncbi:MAG: 2-oxoacid:ferredoxin oxidoreductase subunit beta, partial [Proteobacteria bacterium]|nr:2-oxoacid:ferredoxin oxidoreductase subunit beta [Pseudomonadota bacterium]